ncbi:hypothetical protein MTR67_040694 [Solanum verrucosum]|uniref:Sm domain-containing protein n=1 Tax=Solanum verrucosum TaxID=315347 RepID=A0AAF0UL92_SOLVR|nr:hypothetical protein MTR67_040694 [Solanum verrucosum]
MLKAVNKPAKTTKAQQLDFLPKSKSLVNFSDDHSTNSYSLEAILNSEFPPSKDGRFSENRFLSCRVRVRVLSSYEALIFIFLLSQLPLSLLKTAQGHPMLVELKNGETYNGHLVNCDTWMNIHLREVICTSKDGDRFWRMPECYIRGNTIKYLRVPDENTEDGPFTPLLWCILGAWFDVIDKVQEETKSRGDRKPPGVGGRGRGRGGRDEGAAGRQAKGIGRGMEDAGAKGRGKGGPGAKSGGKGGGRGRG